MTARPNSGLTVYNAWNLTGLSQATSVVSPHILCGISA